MCLLLSTNNVKHRETSRLPCQSGTRRITCNPRNTSYQLPEMPILSDEDVWSQGPEDAGTPEQLAVLDSEIEGLKRDTATAKADYKALVATLATLQTTLTTTDLRESVHALELSKKELLGRLLPLRVGNVSPVSPSEKDSVEQEWRKARMDAFTRKKIFDDFWALLYDNAPDGLVMEELAVSVHRSFLGPRSLVIQCAPAPSPSPRYMRFRSRDRNRDPLSPLLTSTVVSKERLGLEFDA